MGTFSVPQIDLHSLQFVSNNSSEFFAEQLQHCSICHLVHEAYWKFLVCVKQLYPFLRAMPFICVFCVFHTVSVTYVSVQFLSLSLGD